jgi:hypothetical protein
MSEVGSAAFQRQRAIDCLTTAVLSHGCCFRLQGRAAQQLGVVAQQVQGVLRQHGAEDWNIVRQDPQVGLHRIEVLCACSSCPHWQMSTYSCVHSAAC